MTLEEAVERVEIVAQATLYLRPEVTEAMEAVAKVARAFPKMLEALDNLVGSDDSMALADGGIPDHRDGQLNVTAGCIRAGVAALRAARGAVKP